MQCATAIADNGQPEATMKVCLLLWLHLAAQHKEGHWQHWIWKQGQVWEDDGRMKATNIVFRLGWAWTNKPDQGSRKLAYMCHGWRRWQGQCHIGQWRHRVQWWGRAQWPCIPRAWTGKAVGTSAPANGNGNDNDIAMMTPGTVTRAHSARQPEWWHKVLQCITSGIVIGQVPVQQTRPCQRKRQCSCLPCQGRQGCQKRQPRHKIGL